MDMKAMKMKMKSMKMPQPAAEKEAADDLDLESIGVGEEVGEVEAVEGGESGEMESADGMMDAISDEELVQEIMKRGLGEEVASGLSASAEESAAPY